MKGNVPGLTQENIIKLARHNTSVIKLTKKVLIKEKRKMRQFPPENFCPLPEIWSENNSITKEICITIDFPLSVKKIPRRKPLKYNVDHESQFVN